MFSTTTMASSTRMPIEKISANSDTRLSVKPQAQDANSVAASVSSDRGADDHCLAPAERKNTSATTDAVAKISFPISLRALSLAVRRSRGVIVDVYALRNYAVLQVRHARTQAAATSTAFSPGFFVTLSVTAGNSPCASLARGTPCRSQT